MIMMGAAAFCCCVIIIVVIIAVVMNNQTTASTPTASTNSTASANPNWLCTLNKDNTIVGLIPKSTLISTKVTNDTGGANWACNQWVPACNGNGCSVHQCTDTTNNCSSSSPNDNTIWNCMKNNVIVGAIPGKSLRSSNVTNDHGGATWACNQWVPPCNGTLCTADSPSS